MSKRRALSNNTHNGVTLVEMALVLLVVGLLAKSALAPLAGFQAHALQRQAELQIQRVREAIFAHLVAYGALPCPVSTNSASANSLPSYGANDTGRCANANGFVPASSLRLSGAITDEGALLDPWGRELRYAVSLADIPAENVGNLPMHVWTTPGDAARVGIDGLTAQLVLCNRTTADGCSGQSIRADQIAFVVLSTGPDNRSSGAQAENLDSDFFYLVTEGSIVPELYFDDLLAWGSAADVIYWMLRMGWLP